MLFKPLDLNHYGPSATIFSMSNPETQFKRRTLNTALGIAFTKIAIFGAGTAALTQCSNQEKTKKTEQPTFRDWNRQNQEVMIGTTRFEANQPFSRGFYFGDGNPAYFPFDIKIDTGNIVRFRRAVADVLPETASLIVIADDPGLKHETKRSMDPETKITTIAASFDHRIGQLVFWEMRDRTLTNEQVLKEFAQRAERELLMWMVYEVYVAAGVAKRQSIQPTINEEVLLEAARREALSIALDKAPTLPSPFKVSAYITYNYRSHYQQLD